MARAGKTGAPKSKFDKKLDTAFSEVYEDEPSTVTATGKTGKAKTSMLRAIAFSKARAAMKKKG